MKILYNGVSMTVDDEYSVKEAHGYFVDVFPELKNITPRLKVDSDGKALIIYDIRQVFFAYIVLNGKSFAIKDINSLEMARKVAQLSRGDVLSIEGLGTLQIFNIFNDIDASESYEEIGLYCERVTL